MLSGGTGFSFEPAYPSIIAHPPKARRATGCRRASGERGRTARVLAGSPFLRERLGGGQDRSERGIWRANSAKGPVGGVPSRALPSRVAWIHPRNRPSAVAAWGSRSFRTGTRGARSRHPHGLLRVRSLRAGPDSGRSTARGGGGAACLRRIRPRAPCSIPQRRSSDNRCAICT